MDGCASSQLGVVHGSHFSVMAINILQAELEECLLVVHNDELL